MNNSSNKSDSALSLMIEHKGMIVKLMRSFPMQDLTEEDLWNDQYLDLIMLE